MVWDLGGRCAPASFRRTLSLLSSNARARFVSQNGDFEFGCIVGETLRSTHTTKKHGKYLASLRGIVFTTAPVPSKMHISLFISSLAALLVSCMTRVQASEAIVLAAKEDDAYWERLLQEVENFSIAPITRPNLRPTPQPLTPSPTQMPQAATPGPTQTPPTIMPTPSPTPSPPTMSTVDPTPTPPTPLPPTTAPPPTTSQPTPDQNDCSEDGFCNENCSVLTPDPDCSTEPDTEPKCTTVISDFEGGDEAWTITGDAQGGRSDPDWLATDGNPGGYISATDDVQGGIWYFRGPIKFNGNFAGAYGRNLSFDLRQSRTISQVNRRDVIIEGGGLEIWYDTEMNPGTNWTSYRITIDEAAGWRLNESNQIATEDDIRTALSFIDDIYIRGEFINGADIGDLDNVVLETVC